MLNCAVLDDKFQQGFSVKATAKRFRQQFGQSRFHLTDFHLVSMSRIKRQLHGVKCTLEQYLVQDRIGPLDGRQRCALDM